MKTLERRVRRLEDEHGDDTESGIRHVPREEIERYWREEWQPGSPTPTQGPGVALVSRELTIDAWAEKYGSIEIDTENENE